MPRPPASARGDCRSAWIGGGAFEGFRRRFRRMGEENVQRRGESGNLTFPVSQQRSRCNKQRRRHGGLRGSSFALELKQKRQSLYRLAEAHVICQAGSQPEPRHESEPAHTFALGG